MHRLPNDLGKGRGQKTRIYSAALRIRAPAFLKNLGNCLFSSLVEGTIIRYRVHPETAPTEQRLKTSIVPKTSVELAAARSAASPL